MYWPINYLHDSYKYFFLLITLRYIIRGKRTSALLEAYLAQSVLQLGYGLDDWGIGIRFPSEAGDSYLLHNVQTVSGAHPASYKMRTGGCLAGVNFTLYHL
jgi:hypothetical protein